MFKTDKESCEERRRYQNDVSYEVWRRGGNPDRIDPDRVQDHYYNEQDVDSAASVELRVQQSKYQRLLEDKDIRRGFLCALEESLDLPENN